MTQADITKARTDLANQLGTQCAVCIATVADPDCVSVSNPALRASIGAIKSTADSLMKVNRLAKQLGLK